LVGNYTSTYFYEDKTQEEVFKNRELLLEEHRPSSVESRKTAVFAFDNAEKCYTYAETQFKNQHYYIYKVRTNNCSAHPFAIVDSIELGNNPLILIKEYWEPQESWIFLEYLCSEIEIIDRLGMKDIDMIKHFAEREAHGADMRKAKSL